MPERDPDRVQTLLRGFSQRAYHADSLIGRWRSRRMRDFVQLVHPPAGATILDLGGTPFNWSLIDHDYRITLLNLPRKTGDPGNEAAADGIQRVAGDACDLGDVFEDGAFDVVFSNSVIEHVGDEARQERFRDEVLRLAPAHWIQTPSDRFPIEAHTGVPFYFRLPQPILDRLHAGWQRKLPGWFEMVQNTTVLSRARMQALFPDSELYIERTLLLEKSYASYRPFPG